MAGAGVVLHQPQGFLVSLDLLAEVGEIEASAGAPQLVQHRLLIRSQRRRRRRCVAAAADRGLQVFGGLGVVLDHHAAELADAVGNRHALGHAAGAAFVLVALGRRGDEVLGALAPELVRGRAARGRTGRRACTVLGRCGRRGGHEQRGRASESQGADQGNLLVWGRRRTDNLRRRPRFRWPTNDCSGDPRLLVKPFPRL